MLAGYPGVDSVETRGESVLLQCSDSDAALRMLVANTTAHDIEVVAHGLEDAFIALTTELPEARRSGASAGSGPADTEKSAK